MLSNDDSLALHTDLYQINMAETYWTDGIHDRRAVFDLYFREMPFNNGYAIFAGLERIIDYVQKFKFHESDLTYLKDNLGYSEDFLEYLRQLRFTGDIKSVCEGEVVFGNEPLLRVEAPLAEVQLLETALLNIVNYQTLIAYKAARIRNIFSDDFMINNCTIRAQYKDNYVRSDRVDIICFIIVSVN